MLQFLRDICQKTCENARIFMMFAQKFNKISEFYMIFARKMPEFYMIIVWKIFFPNSPLPRLLHLCWAINKPNSNEFWKQHIADFQP